MTFLPVLWSSAVAGSLQSVLQAFIDGEAQKTGYAIEVGWKSADLEFGIAAGKAQSGQALKGTDIFLFGSGTKPYTSAALLRLAERGVINLDDPAGPAIDSALAKLGETTTFAELFGDAASLVTVRQLISMQAGIADYDVPTFDRQMLDAGNVTHSPVEFVKGASAVGAPFVCQPGSCTSYSSTNYVLAGLVLLAYDGKASSWEDVDQSFILPSSAHLTSSSFLGVGPLDGQVSVAGSTAYGDGGAADPTSVYTQDASILGWTCGNLAAPAAEVARWMWSLFTEGSVLSPASLTAMQDFHTLDVGWAKGTIQYGLGLMIQQTALWAKMPPSLDDWGAYMGHGGDTYGFLSEQGWIPQLNATFSVVANQDINGGYVKGTLACNTIKLAAKELLGQDAPMRCTRSNDIVVAH